MAAVDNELEADEDAREYAHDEHGGGPGGPCDGAEEHDERDKGQTRREREEEVRAVEVQRERLYTVIRKWVFFCWT
jgi:hypothetical protein